MAKKKLYVQLYNIHGLIRGHDLELGRDADTGGQTKYVLELAKSISRRDEIERVEIVTRFINDKELSQDYAETEEIINDKLSIIRIRCGGQKYLRKEQLWEHLEEFVDKSIKYIKSRGVLPDIIHSHYADAGYACAELTKFFGIPFIHTGHSLGINKLNNLLQEGMTYEEINRRYKIQRRIEAEEQIILYADKIITSTNQEIEEQYKLYHNFNREKFVVIPPSVDLSKFHPYNEKREWDEESQKIRDGIRNELWKFFTNMNKPIILSLCRPEKRKNITGLIEAYGRSEELQHKANLAVFAGIRKDITQMPDIEREVLTDMLLLMDKYNLYGKMAIPKKHDFEHEVPELYRIAAESRGVFVNSAFNEPFGLTLIEAAASGLPVVATDDGGPRDIIHNLQNGLLVDVHNPDNISNALLTILNDESKWETFSNNGINRVKHFYSWDAHTEKYLNIINELVHNGNNFNKVMSETGKRLFNFDKLIILDIDDTLLGDEKSTRELNDLLKSVHSYIGFGVATGRSVDSAVSILKENDIVMPDFIISSVGSEIHYKSDEGYTFGTGWAAHIDYQWKRDKIVETLKDFDYLTYQEEENQRKYKISYYIDTTKFNPDEIMEALTSNKLKANIIVSHEQFLDILPVRASKGRAVRYIGYRWNIPYDSILVAGDSGNDEDMLRGELLGVVVANYSKELEKLIGRRRIYFASKPYAAGVIEGIQYYNFIR
ncbi:sucrose-phosphate synthase [Melioribacter roseus P3M-2]|uniref:sucrose-phosphate synthase n=1 Tax=Melioribacter roseus (strain DSM 23840 / JCM 17771 / VKM B-2668 / P3M-2) TaxID=1191523 RepID=I6YVH2_MELRP|nr:HAD-IIB family hydrolase [Melioribacter roseus]AFN74552.1 sucrose-phosphate synthase [Melioribacter roseus P3M-2]